MGEEPIPGRSDRIAPAGLEEERLDDALETKRRLEAVLWSAMDAIISIDGSNRVIFFNPAAEVMFGMSGAEALGRSIDCFIPERFRPQHGEHIRRFGQTGETGRRMGALGALSALRADGTEFPVEASISQAMNGNEQIKTVILRDVTERVANEEIRVLLAREVDHRARNALSIVQAMISLTRAPTIEAFVEAVEGRVAALARAHSLLARNQWAGGNLRQVVDEELAAYVQPGQLVCTGSDLELGPHAVQPIGLLLHELATNAVKYGALSTQQGKVDLSWHIVDDDGFVLEWRESGGPPVDRPTRRGFGSTLISSVTAQQLNGTVTMEFNPDGLVATAHLPFDVIRSAHWRRASSAPAPLKGTDDQATRGRLLIVEDEVLIAMQMARELSADGWEVIGPAASIPDALELMGSVPRIDAAVLDVNLNGQLVGPLVEVLRDAKVPILLSTGYEEVDEDVRSGCTVLRKPVAMRALLAGIDEAIRTTRAA